MATVSASSWRAARQTRSTTRRRVVRCAASHLEEERGDGRAARGRRDALALGAAALGSYAALAGAPGPARADALPKVLVAGATGATGRLVVGALQGRQAPVVAAARSEKKARDVLGAEVPYTALDVVNDDVATIANAMRGAEVVVCATGFVPGSPFEMGKMAHAVDNVGTVKLVDAAKQAGVRRFVLVSSILTNGRAIGQQNSIGFRVTNAFGGVLDEKLVAEQALRASGLEWVIVRPGGLKDGAPSGELAVSAEDTLFSGEVTRSLVADVCAEAALGGATGRVVEVVETGTCVAGSCPADLAAAPADPARWLAA